ncbi:hypothetical protein ACFPLB_10210 [Aquamicrobium segne]|uniref:Uncharacterized protein n=1 Tax=Aquamicrobium segne TaxID=469547 RepID=A0ABW0GY69_9HYPH
MCSRSLVHALVLGGEYFNALPTDQNPGRRTGEDEKFQVTQWALFAEDEWCMTDTFALTDGLVHGPPEFFCPDIPGTGHKSFV